MRKPADVDYGILERVGKRLGVSKYVYLMCAHVPHFKEYVQVSTLTDSGRQTKRLV